MEAVGSDCPVPDWPPLGTNQVSALPEGSRVVAMWSGDLGAREYVVHRESGRLYAVNQSDVEAGTFSRDKVLTFVTRVWLPKA
jgi:hypothetical protein